MHPDLVADARKIHESGKFRRSPGNHTIVDVYLYHQPY